MTPIVLAQGGAIDLIWWLKVVIVVAFVVGVAYGILNYFGLLGKVPPLAWYILWGFLLVVLALVAISYLARFL